MPRHQSPKARAPRYTGRKISSGCWTCRSRHLKCDKARPSCQRCAKACISCEGYDMRLTWIPAKGSPACQNAESRGSKSPSLAPTPSDFDCALVCSPALEATDSQKLTSQDSPFTSTDFTLAEQGRYTGGILDCQLSWPLGYNEIMNYVYSPEPDKPCVDISRAEACLARVAPSFPDRFDIATLFPEQKYFLESKGAVDLLPSEFRDQLLMAYLKWVHPQLPVLDVESILTGLLLNNQTQFTSPILYQAVMFAGSAFVDIKYVKAAGYHSRINIRKVLFTRARLLYDFDCETNPLFLVKALLLMSLWHDTTEDHRDPRYWLSVAWSIASKASLFQGYLETRKWRRRLWWCFHVRDKLISLGLQKPVILKTVELDDEPMTVDDLWTEIHDIDIVLVLPDVVPLFAFGYQSATAMIFIQTAHLCTFIHYILESYYECTWGPTLGGRYGLCPNRTLDLRDIRRCHDSLKAWANGLPEVVRYHPSLLWPPGDAYSVEVVFLVQQANLRMIFLTTTCALLHPIARTEPNGCWEQYRREAASEITRMTEDLSCRGFLSLLTNSSITALTFAAFIHLVDLECPLQVHNHAVASLTTAVSSLRELGLVYPSSQTSLCFLEAARKTLNTRVDLASVFSSA